LEKRVLVVDDDRLIREMTRDVLVTDGLGVTLAASGPEAMARIEESGPFDVVVTDLSMREMDGLELLERIKRASPKTDVIISTNYASLESALEAMRLGASDYLRKPVKPPEILYSVKRTLLRRRIVEENKELRGSLQAFESSRVLMSCLESTDILPLSLDLILNLLERTRAVARLIDGGARQPSELYVRGFADETAASLRRAILAGKAFDPSELPPGVASALLEPPRALRQLEVADPQLLALPLRVEDRVAGAIWILSDGRSFEVDEVRRAELLIAQAELSLTNAERFLQAREKAFIDDVTDLYNSRYLMSALDREVSRADRSGLDLSVLFLDLDRFKRVNDQYGHLVGSRVLRELGEQLRDSVRSIDTVARYGGDEFTLVLVETGLQSAMQVAERIRSKVEQTPFGAERGLELRLSLSIGVSSFPAHGVTREMLIDQADKAMYRGKSLGRNRVCSADELSEPDPGPPIDDR
jgi:diguanylate cyclase (GGDEF)-like protein